MKDDILDAIGGDVRTISEFEKEALENPISLDEVNTCLKAMRNNVSSGMPRFSRAFNKMFWFLLKYIVLAAIH